MSRAWPLSLGGLSLAALLLAPLTRAENGIAVDERATRLLFNEGYARLSLVVENSSGQSETATIRIEVLAPNDDVRTTTEPSHLIMPGRQKLLIDLPLATSQLDQQERAKLLWYRIRYRIASTSPGRLAPATGIVSLSEITPDLFEIRVAGSEYVREGLKYRATVRAAHPITDRPSPSVNVSGQIKFDTGDDNESAILKASAITDDKGFAVLDFNLPQRLESDEIDVSITGIKSGFRAQANDEIEVIQYPFFVITTDKGIYQPGQVLHTRVLLLDPSKHARADEPLTLTITDPDGHEEFRKALITSKFGIASADWTIPDSATLGEYRVELETENDQSGSASVKISRYELPNFTVNVKPDRPYYLPTQNATVDIGANYLFGEAVKRGHVRVVREGERLWNYKDQRYETQEDEKYEGEVDEKGVFRLQIDLTKHLRELEQEDYNRYRDVNYAAYFTDPSTNRTEQRRFDLRLTKEAIHLYVVRIGNRYAESSRLPLSFYVSASYADGNPAQCNLSLNEVTSENKRTFGSTVRTNRYGLAKIKASLPDNSDNSFTLGFVARDRSGKTATHNEEFELRDEEILRVESRKALYARGEAIAVTITSSETNPTVLLQLSQDWAVLHSQAKREFCHSSR